MNCWRGYNFSSWICFLQNKWRLCKHIQNAIVTAGYLKSGLAKLCAAAHELGIEIDPDGLVEDKHEVIQDKLKTSCGELMCGKSLVEVQCLSSKQNSWPAITLIMNGIVVRNFDGSLSINPTHTYYYQMQSQMSITEIHVCYLVAYIHKGISLVQVDFDPQFWKRVLLSIVKCLDFGHITLLFIVA